MPNQRPDQPVKWVLHEPDLIRRRYDDIWVIFQHSAGKTHFLNNTTALILETLDHGPAGAAEVCASLAGESADTVSDQERQFIAMHMQRLEALGLIRRTEAAGIS